MLTTDDWLELELIHDALETFHAATMHVEEHDTFLSNWTNAIDKLMDMIGEARDSFKKLAVANKATRLYEFLFMVV
ncbi:hypothetical protein E4U39_007588 [Claviceps sp. Clav50 group G5]|nr:hypothetical protein E4U39_007588 [Claviceps sp. Clav50 group G5]